MYIKNVLKNIKYYKICTYLEKIAKYVKLKKIALNSQYYETNLCIT